jgi:hypothetical protein
MGLKVTEEEMKKHQKIDAFWKCRECGAVAAAGNLC